MAQTVWQDVYLHLKENGFEVYPPATKNGECKHEYIVVKNNGSSQHQSFSTDVDLYMLMCYVPKDKYSTLELFVQEVKKCMKRLYPQVIPYGQQSASYFDDNVKAHMISITYKNHKKI